jgi:hypothetical protein
MSQKSPLHKSLRYIYIHKASAAITVKNLVLLYFNSGQMTAISFTLVPVKPVKMSEFNFLKA